MENSESKPNLPVNRFKTKRDPIEGTPPEVVPLNNGNLSLPTDEILQASASPRPNTEEEARQVGLGKDLAKRFKDKKVHPVLIFGSKGSGKTSLIASLLKYMRDRPESDASIEFADSVLPDDDPWWEQTKIWSQDVFYKRVLAYIDNLAPESTQESQPFFIPISLTTKTGIEVKFALLEGKGEWYQPNLEATVPFQKFKSFLQGFLQGYNDTATVIYVAPYVTGSVEETPKSTGLRASDLGLLGAINEYLSLRKAFVHQDQHMFLLTKWDVFCASVAAPEFIEPLEEEIQGVFRERYLQSWTRYLNSSVSQENQNRTYSAYCAGLIDGRTVVTAATEDDERVAFYARKLWDWLYQNASGLTLYPDVRPKPLGRFDQFLKWLRG